MTAPGRMVLRDNGEVTLTFDPERGSNELTCADCGAHYTLVKGFVYEDHAAHAIYFAACHNHDEVHEAWIDVILGSFGEGDPTDHVTFGCRVGPIPGQLEPQASLVPAGRPYNDPILGQKLTREEALAHPRLDDYWAVVDFVLTEDPIVHEHVYG